MAALCIVGGTRDSVICFSLFSLFLRYRFEIACFVQVRLGGRVLLLPRIDDVNERSVRRYSIYICKLRVGFLKQTSTQIVAR